jgi:hypothetical protein
VRVSNLKYTQLRTSKRKTIVNSDIRVSGPTIVERPEDVLSKKFMEKDAKVTLDTYRRFFMASPLNCCLVPFTLILFVFCEIVVTAYYRILADFDSVLAGTSSNFGGDFTQYWVVLAVIIVIFFIVLVIKFYSLNLSLINASTAVHENMI